MQAAAVGQWLGQQRKHAVSVCPRSARGSITGSGLNYLHCIIISVETISTRRYLDEEAGNNQGNGNGSD